MSDSLLNALLDGPFALSRRPIPMPGDLRRTWGIPLVVLILGKSRGKRASIQKLHFLAHSIRTEAARTEVQMVFEGTLKPSDIYVRFEPWLNRAIAFAKGAGLLEMEGGKGAQLTALGLKLFDALYTDNEVFSEEKEFLEIVSVKATERNIEKIMRMESAL